MGVATTTRAAFNFLRAATAASIVEPVATPSSTTITVFPSTFIVVDHRDRHVRAVPVPALPSPRPNQLPRWEWRGLHNGFIQTAHRRWRSLPWRVPAARAARAFAQQRHPSALSDSLQSAPRPVSTTRQGQNQDVATVRIMPQFPRQQLAGFAPIEEPCHHHRNRPLSRKLLVVPSASRIAKFLARATETGSEMSTGLRPGPAIV